VIGVDTNSVEFEAASLWFIFLANQAPIHKT